MESKINNKMSLNALKERENDSINVYPSKKNASVLFFTCGSTVGYVSKQAKAALEAGESNRLMYGEVTTDDGVVIPTLMCGQKATYTL